MEKQIEELKSKGYQDFEDYGLALGCDITAMFRKMKWYEAENHDQKYYFVFNGNLITSDMTEDEAFETVVGCSKEEFKAYQEKEEKERQRKESEFQKNKSTLIEKYIERGRGLVKNFETWEKCVPIRVDDLYHGWECEACLEIIEARNSGCDFEALNEILRGQGHSGMSHGLVMSMLRKFMPEGEEFYEFEKTHR